MSLTGKLILNEHECAGNYDFSISEKYMASGFQDTFGPESIEAAFTAVSLIMEAYPHNADCLQTFIYISPDGKEKNFWVIHDMGHYTFLLPEEY